MPFKETCRMEERIDRMLSEYDTGNWSISDLCRSPCGICRDTFGEWRKRRGVQAIRRNGLWIIRIAPLHCPHRTEAAISEAAGTAALSGAHIWDRACRSWCVRLPSRPAGPAASTIGDILQRAGLITPAKRRCGRQLDGGGRRRRLRHATDRAGG